MPEATSEDIKLKVVELKKAGKSYSQIRRETGIKHDGTIVKILRQAGLTRTAAPNGPATLPAQPPTPSTQARGQPLDVREFMPEPLKPARPNPAAPQTFGCSDCRQTFRLDPGENLADITECPGCGESFE